jgi:hypothetical protein
MARPTLAYAKTGMRTANTSSANSVLRRLGVPIEPMVDVWCVGVFVLLLMV